MIMKVLKLENVIDESELRRYILRTQRFGKLSNYYTA